MRKNQRKVGLNLSTPQKWFYLLRKSIESKWIVSKMQEIEKLKKIIFDIKKNTQNNNIVNLNLLKLIDQNSKESKTNI